MAATHELLSFRQWKGVSLRELVRRELAPYVTGSNTAIAGPELMLPPEVAQAVSMALHELTTNAAKHGGLSTESGRVAVCWTRANGRIRIEWSESGGPPVEPPKRPGYGMEVIRDLIPYELHGTVDLAFAPQGLRCTLDIPVASARGGERPEDRTGNARNAPPLPDVQRQLIHLS
jgi:two-component sensor histidine kinase